MKILFLSRWFPYPITNGSKLRILNLLKGLAKAHEVHLLSFADSPESADVAYMAKFCTLVGVVQWHEYEPGSWRAAAGLFSPLPRSLVFSYSKEMERAILCAMESQPFDLIITSAWQMTAYRHLFSDVPVLYEEIEVGVFHQLNSEVGGLASRMWQRLSWIKHSQYLRNAIRPGQICTVVSEQEKKLLGSILSSGCRIEVIPNGVDLQSYASIREQPDPYSMIFTGPFRYRPNYQAMLWFIKEIFPLIRQVVPDATLKITGDPDGLALPETPGVHHLGFVDDIRPLIARSWVSIVPILQGGGTRLKILEAMSLRTPVVSTPKGAEGLSVENEIHLLIGSDPECFARHVINLFHDLALRERLRENALRLVGQEYDWEVIMPRFASVVDQFDR